MAAQIAARRLFPAGYAFEAFVCYPAHGKGGAGTHKLRGQGVLDWSVILFGTFLGFVSLSIVYDIALYVAMRERFLVWHTVRLGAMIVMALAGSDAYLGGALADPESRRHLKLLALDTGIAVTGPFLVAYMEKGVLGRRLAQMLNGSFALVYAVTIIPFVAPVEALPNAVRHAVFMVILALIIAGLAQGVRRGSRAARFQSVAWAVILACSVTAVGYELLYNAQWPLWSSSILVALTIEVVVSAVGVSDRIMVLRRDRDAAIARESAAALAAATDPLTGLANRRGLDARLTDPSLPAPSAVAVVDLDHFKRVNDEYGHDAGDAVLVAAAAALAGHQVFAARMGGEEFALLLFSPDPVADAEALRRRIAALVAAEVAEVGAPVTASMGLCRLAAGDDAETAFQKADDALYLAKRAGRDRKVVVPFVAPGALAPRSSVAA